MGARQFDEVSDMDLSRNAGVSRDELEQLRRDVRTSLTDELFNRLHNMDEVTDTDHTDTDAVHGRGNRH